MVDEVAQVEVLLRVLRYSPVSIILSVLHRNLFLDAIRIVKLRTFLNNTVTIHSLWMILMVIHNERRKSGVIFHGVYYPLFIIQSCHV